MFNFMYLLAYIKTTFDKHFFVILFINQIKTKLLSSLSIFLLLLLLFIIIEFILNII